MSAIHDNTNPAEKSLLSLESFLRGSGFVVLGMGAKICLVFVAELLAARILLPERYGLITWALFLVNILCMFTGLGLSTAARRFIPIFHSRGETGAVRGTVILSGAIGFVGGVVGGLSLFFGSEWLAETVLGDPREKAVLMAFVFALPLWNVLKSMLAVMGGFSLPRYKVLIEDLLVPFGFLLVILLAWWAGWQETQIAYGYVLVYFVGAGLSVLVVWKKTPYRQVEHSAPDYRTRELLRFSWPLIFTEPVGKCTGIIDVLILGMLSTPYSVGLYRTVSDMAVMISLVLLCFGFMYFPMAAKLAEGREFHQWNDVNARVARWSMLLSFPLFSTLFFFPNEVILFLYGQEYVAGAPILRILAVAYFGHTMVGFTAVNLIAAGMTRIQFLIHLTAFALNILGNILLIPSYGVKGAAYASLLSLWSLNIASILVMKWKLNLQPFTRLYVFGMLSLLLSAYGGSLLLHAFDPIYGLFSIIVFLLYCFMLMMLFSWSGFLIDETDRVLIRSVSKRLVESLRPKQTLQNV